MPVANGVVAVAWRSAQSYVNELVPAVPSALLASVSSGFQARSVRTVAPRFVWSGRPRLSFPSSDTPKGFSSLLAPPRIRVIQERPNGFDRPTIAEQAQSLDREVRDRLILEQLEQDIAGARIASSGKREEDKAAFVPVTPIAGDADQVPGDRRVRDAVERVAESPAHAVTTRVLLRVDPIECLDQEPAKTAPPVRPDPAIADRADQVEEDLLVGEPRQPSGKDGYRWLSALPEATEVADRLDVVAGGPELVENRGRGHPVSSDVVRLHAGHLRLSSLIDRIRLEPVEKLSRGDASSRRSI